MRPVLWIVRWTLWAVGTALWVAAPALLAGWAFGRVATDRWAWSQYLFWLPSILVVPGVIAGLAGALACRALSRRVSGRNARPGRGEWRGVRFAALAVALAAGYVAAGEYRWFSPGPAASSGSFRVIHWNASNDIGSTWDLNLLDQNADLLVVNPASYQHWDRLLEKFPHAGSPLWTNAFAVFSAYPVLRWTFTSLSIDPGVGIDPRDPEHLTRRSDSGHAMFLELDTRAKLGRTMIVWCLDLPSDITLPRRRVTEQAAHALANFRGTVQVRGEDGIYARVTPATPGFPPPDLILGDMNIPRGSMSLSRLAGACTPAFDQAGSGPSATWPYRRPVFHLDQMFVGPWLRAVDYRALDLGGGTHRAQRADLVVRE